MNISTLDTPVGPVWVAVDDDGAVTVVNVGGFPWGRQTTQLFRADRYPDGLLKLAKTLGIFSGFSVIAGTKANETTTY